MGNQTNNFYGPIGQFVDHPQNNVQFVTFQSDGTMRVDQPQDSAPDVQDNETTEDVTAIDVTQPSPINDDAPLDLFLVNDSHSRSDCEWMLKNVFEMSRSKKMVCEELYKLEGIYFKLNSVEREKRVKWLNSQPSRWQGEFKYEDMKYWRKTK